MYKLIFLGINDATPWELLICLIIAAFIIAVITVGLIAMVGVIFYFSVRFIVKSVTLLRRDKIKRPVK
jgi:hypothetical protein